MNLSAFPEQRLDSVLSGDAIVTSDVPSIFAETTRAIVVQSDLQSHKPTVQYPLAQNKSHLERRHALIVCEPSNGKAMLLDKTIAETHRSRSVFAHGYRSGQRVLTAHLSEIETPARMARGLLRALGDQSAHAGSCAFLTERLMRHIEQRGSGMILIRLPPLMFVQGSGNKGCTRTRWQAARCWFKALMLATNATIALIDTPEASSEIDSDEQFRPRFTQVNTLTQFAGPS